MSTGHVRRCLTPASVGQSVGFTFHDVILALSVGIPVSSVDDAF